MSIHLGGSSRQSLEAGRAALDKVISGANADSLSKLSQDLFVVVNGLGTSIALRRAVTDPARNDADKNALFKEIFANKISANALELAGSVATKRWSKPSDLLVALEQIAVEAEAGAANSRGELDKLEDEGLSAILDNNWQSAHDAFTKAESVYPGYHNCYEISRYLTSNKLELSNQSSPLWNDLYKRLLNEWSWGIPGGIKQSIKSRIE